MNTAKISCDYKIVIPKEAREALGLGAGDELVVIAKKDRIELVPRLTSYTSATLGLGKEVWDDVDEVNFVKGERNAWEKKARS